MLFKSEFASLSPGFGEYQFISHCELVGWLLATVLFLKVQYIFNVLWLTASGESVMWNKMQTYCILKLMKILRAQFGFSLLASCYKKELRENGDNQTWVYPW